MQKIDNPLVVVRGKGVLRLHHNVGVYFKRFPLGRGEVLSDFVFNQRVERFEIDCKPDFWPIEVWYYQGSERTGTEFLLLFYKIGGSASPFLVGFFLVVAGSSLSTEGYAPLLIATDSAQEVYALLREMVETLDDPYTNFFAADELGDPEAYLSMVLHLSRGDRIDQRFILRRLATLQYKRNEVELQKSNIMLLGPTGCGKTLLAEAVSDALGMPLLRWNIRGDFVRIAQRVC